MFDVNFCGVVAVTLAFAPLIPKRERHHCHKQLGLGIRSPAAAIHVQLFRNDMQMIMDTLRIEMNPFGVKVTTVITAVVGTKPFEKLPGTKFLDTSTYTPAKEETEKAAGGEFIPSPMELAVFARKVVSDLTKSRPNV